MLENEGKFLIVTESLFSGDNAKFLIFSLSNVIFSFSNYFTL